MCLERAIDILTPIIAIVVVYIAWQQAQREIKDWYSQALDLEAQLAAAHQRP